MAVTVPSFPSLRIYIYMPGTLLTTICTVGTSTMTFMLLILDTPRTLDNQTRWRGQSLFDASRCGYELYEKRWIKLYVFAASYSILNI